MFDPNPVLDSKVGTKASNNLILNSSASISSLLYNQPNDFLFWLQENYVELEKKYPELLSRYKSTDLTPNSFLPRKLFLVYMEHTFQKYCKRAEYLGIKVEIVNEYVTNIHANSSQIQIATPNNLFQASQVILCVGNHKGYPNEYEHLAENPNYFDNPYSDKFNCHNNFEGKRILVIGSMSSAVDVIILLKECIGKIRLVSRTGVYPKMCHSSGDSLESNKLFSEAQSITDLTELLIDRINTDENWHEYVYQFFNQLNLLWLKEDTKETDRDYFRILRKYLSPYLFAMPSYANEIVSEKLETGCLEIVGNLSSIVFNKELNQFAVYYKYSSEPEYYDICVNAIGTTNNMKLNLNIEALKGSPNVYIIGKNYISNGIFILAKEANQTIIDIRKHFINEIEFEKKLTHTRKNTSASTRRGVINFFSRSKETGFDENKIFEQSIHVIEYLLTKKEFSKIAHLSELIAKHNWSSAIEIINDISNQPDKLTLSVGANVP